MRDFAISVMSICNYSLIAFFVILFPIIRARNHFLLAIDYFSRSLIENTKNLYVTWVLMKTKAELMRQPLWLYLRAPYDNYSHTPHAIQATREQTFIYVLLYMLAINY